MKAPERACRLQLDIQADTRDEMVQAIEYIATAIDRGEMSTGCSGGVHSGWTYEYVERAGPTHEEYHQQLKAYLAAKRAEKETPAECPHKQVNADSRGDVWCAECGQQVFDR